MKSAQRRTAVLLGALVIFALAGTAHAVPREGRENGRGREQGIMKVIKRVVRALGDGLVIPWP